MSRLRAEILHTLRYFEYFEYPPTVHEVWRYLRVRVSYSTVKSEIHKLITSRQVFGTSGRCTLRQKHLQDFTSKSEHSDRLSHSLLDFLPRLSWIPTIQLIGISGSLSMNDADDTGDIDIFIVTKAYSLWLTRFLVLAITRIGALFGNPTAAKLCWNLMVEEHAMGIPMEKRNEYTAHEVLQLKPVLNKHNTYERFLFENAWVMEIFPNVQIKSIRNSKSYGLSLKSKALYFFDKILRRMQLFWLDRRGYSVTEYDGQAWFIQEDVENHIPLKLKKYQ